MTFEAYISYFDSIIKEPEKFVLYKDPEYLMYTKLNWSRTKRWIKKFVPSDEVKCVVEGIKTPQKWIIITEPWCGDAAHSVPQLAAISKLNPLIDLDIQLRDEEPFLINKYLTNGGKSIPILVIRDDNNNDLAIWGPRPMDAQSLFLSLKAEDKNFDEIKEAIQNWYNEDKGVKLSQEIINLIRNFK